MVRQEKGGGGEKWRREKTVILSNILLWFADIYPPPHPPTHPKHLHAFPPKYSFLTVGLSINVVCCKHADKKITSFFLLYMNSDKSSCKMSMHTSLQPPFLHLSITAELFQKNEPAQNMY